MRTSDGPVCEDRPIVDLSLKRLGRTPKAHIWKLSVSQWSSDELHTYDWKLANVSLLELRHLEVVEWTWTEACLRSQSSNLAQVLVAYLPAANLVIRYPDDQQLYQDVARLLSNVLRSTFETASGTVYTSTTW